MIYPPPPPRLRAIAHAPGRIRTARYTVASIAPGRCVGSMRLRRLEAIKNSLKVQVRL